MGAILYFFWTGFGGETAAETGPPYRTWEARNQGRVFEARPAGRTWEAQ